MSRTSGHGRLSPDPSKEPNLTLISLMYPLPPLWPSSVQQVPMMITPHAGGNGVEIQDCSALISAPLTSTAVASRQADEYTAYHATSPSALTLKDLQNDAAGSLQLANKVLPPHASVDKNSFGTTSIPSTNGVEQTKHPAKDAWAPLNYNESSNQDLMKPSDSGPHRGGRTTSNSFQASSEDRKSVV